MFLFFGYLPFDSSIPTVHQYVTNPTKEELNESLILPSNVESYEVRKSSIETVYLLGIMLVVGPIPSSFKRFAIFWSRLL